MARFIPERRLASPHSAAERKVLDWLAGLDDAWTVLHSVGITDHASKPWAEADVVLVGPRAVLVLEVKGGRVERRNGLWGFRDRVERITWKAEGPYDQAGGAAAALRRHLHQAGVLDSGAAVRWAVLLPDVRMPEAGPDVLAEVTLDASRVWADAKTEIDGILDYWSGRFPETSALDLAMRHAVVDRIRGDLSLRPLASLTAAQVQHQQQRLTIEQQQLVEAAEANPRLLVAGRAGTGKSALAIMLASEYWRSGQRVGYLVYNSALARRARAALAGTEVDVLTVDALALRTARQAGARVGAPGDAAGWQALRASAAEGASSLYDALVVDEAQDFDASAGRLLNRVLKGGLESGTWRAFYDSEQTIFGTPEHGMDLAAFEPARLTLTRNCRSTKQVTTATSMLCQVLLDVQTRVMGPEVSFVWWNSRQEHDAQLGSVLTRKVADYGPDHVLIVGTRALGGQTVDSLCFDAGLAGLSDVRKADTGPFLATTSSVKGLEAQSVIVHGVDDLSSDAARQFLYTACSRASVDLTVLLANSVADDFSAGAAWLGTRLGRLVAGPG